MTNSTKEIVKRFAEITCGKTFISFQNISESLGISTSQVISLKYAFEDELRKEDDNISLVSRIDLNPQGFEIVC